MPPRTRRTAAAAPAASSPTARRWELARRLKELRLEAGYSLEDVAGELMCSTAKISRIETGQRGIQARDVRDLSRFYGLDSRTQEQLMSLVSEAARRGWWSSYRSLPTEMSDFVGLESAAKCARVYHPIVIPGLLQTEEYTEALVQGLRPDSAWPREEREEVVASRKLRRDRLLQGGLEYHAVLDEAALLRRVGDRECMKRQAESLLQDAQRPNVSVQVVELNVGSYPGLDGGFQWMSFHPGTVGDVVYVEGHLGLFILDKPAESQRYREIFDDIVNRFALTKERTHSWLSAWIEAQ